MPAIPLASYRSSERALLRFAAAGAAVTIATVAWNFASGRFQALDLFMQATILVIVPLALVLDDDAANPPGGPDLASLRELLLVSYPAAAVLAVVADWLPIGALAGVLALPYLLVTGLRTGLSVLRALRRGFTNPEEVAVDASSAFLSHAAFWYVAARLGAHPLGVPDPIVLLSAVHFTNAGFTALFSCGLLGRFLAREGQIAASRALLLTCAGGIFGPLLTATGIAYALHSVEISGALFMESGYFVMGFVLLFAAAPRVPAGPARGLLVVSGAGLLVGMALALCYTFRVWGIPEMIPRHGSVMALLFCVSGLLGWVALGPQRARRIEVAPGYAEATAALAALTVLPFLGQLLFGLRVSLGWHALDDGALGAWFGVHFETTNVVLQGMGALVGLSLGAAAACAPTTTRRVLHLTALGAWGATAALTPVVFDGLNDALRAGAGTGTTLADTVTAWQRWQGVRIALGVVGAGAVLVALHAGSRPATRTTHLPNALATALTGALVGGLALLGVLGVGWPKSAPTDALAWLQANLPGFRSLLVLLWGAALTFTTAALVAGWGSGARRRILLVVAILALAGVAAIDTLGNPDGRLLSASAASFGVALERWPDLQMARLTAASLALLALVLAPSSLAGGPLAPTVRAPLPLSRRAATAAPHRTLAEVEARLDVLAAEMAKAQDRMGIIAILYDTMFVVLRRHLAEGRFEDPAWVSRFALGLANLYENALDRWRAGDEDAVPPWWREAFAATGHGDGPVTHDHLLCLNAHLLHDHVESLLASDLDPWDGRHARDYRRIDRVLAESTPAATVRVAATFTPRLASVAGPAARLLGPVAHVVMEAVRQRAWNQAVAVMEAGGPAAATVALDRFEADVAASAVRLAESRKRPGLMRAFLRLVEGSSDPRLPPGDLGLPLLGQTLAYARDPAGFLRERRERYGNVHQARLLGRDLVVLAGAEAFALLGGAERERHFVRRGANPHHWTALMGGDTVAHVDGAARAERKRRLLDATSGAAALDAVPSLAAVLDEYGARWEGLGSFDWVPELRRCAYSTCDTLVRGAPASAEVPPDAGDVDALYDALYGPPFPLPLSPMARGLRWRNTFQADVRARLRAGTVTGDQGVLGRLVAGGARDPDVLAADLMQVWFGTYAALYCAWACSIVALARWPELRMRLADELSADGSPADAPYTLAFTREVRRFFPLTPNTLFSTVIRPFEIGGYRIPAGRVVIGAIDATHADPATFADPGRFDPARFLGAPPAGWVAHGGGAPEAHGCPGVALADAALTLFAARAAGRWAWALGGAPPEIARSGLPLPVGGLPVRFSVPSVATSGAAVAP